MTSIPESNLSTLAACEKEPIHIPGRIQPFGVLLSIDPASFVIQNISENCLKLWDRHSFALLGRSLTEFLTPQAQETLRRHIENGEHDVLSPIRLNLAFDEYIQRDWDIRIHHHQDVLYLECEPVDKPVARPSVEEWHLDLRQAISAMHASATLQQMCEAAVNQVRRLTGFGRVMMYRFDEEWHGKVIAEARDAGMESYLGLQFPASDIPAQARAIFLQNALRMIPDVDYTPARIYPNQHPQSGGALDLSRAMLRSVSPVHLEYLRNMKVKASLTISLVKDEKLWGLIACHHRSPLLADADARIAAEMIGHLVSAQLATKEEAQDRDIRRTMERQVAALLNQLAAGDNLADRLQEHASELLHIGAEHASGFAATYAGAWACAGQTPAPAQMAELLQWAAGQADGTEIFCTYRLSHFYPASLEWNVSASGLVVAWINRAQCEALVWFRPEVATTVAWAGEPNKAVHHDGGGLRPRASFATWTEVVKGRARPWTRTEMNAMESLRIGIVALALQQERRGEQAARERAERLSREKDEMVAMVSHDLKTPLNVIALSFDYLQRNHPAAEASVQRMLERGVRASKMMEKLIVNILDVAKLEAGTLDVKLRPENALGLIREAVDLSMAVAQQKGVSLQVAMPPEKDACFALCEQFRIHQVLSNLIGNALKFTPPGGTVTVSMRRQETELEFRVDDTGEGIHADNLEKIFDRFWQVADIGRAGTGLGLWIAKGIVETHRGRIWAASELGKGSTFRFTLPLAHC